MPAVATPPKPKSLDTNRWTIKRATGIGALSPSKLAQVARADLAIKPAFGMQVLGLDARHPYDDAGLMDFYKPGRWDSTYNLIFMDTIVLGADPGEWDGTAGYGRFTPPGAGDYLIAVHFSGYQTTMRLFGPWGESMARTATTADEGIVVALCTAPNSQDLYFNFNCVADSGSYGIGYLESIQIFAL